MGNIGIVTDSTAYLSPEKIKELQVEVVSLVVNFGDQSWPEASVSDFSDFYDQLRQVSYLPTTSQPSMGDFLQVYERMAGKVDSIISIHIYWWYQRDRAVRPVCRQDAAGGGHLRGRLRRYRHRTLNDGRYRLPGYCRRLGKGAGAAGHRIHQRSHEAVVFEDGLEYLRKGGRIGGAAALVGTLLQVKPILYFNPRKDNIIDVYEKIRTQEKGLQRILDEVDKAYRQSPDLKLGIVHVGAEAEGKALMQRVQGLYPELYLECARWAR